MQRERCVHRQIPHQQREQRRRKDVDALRRPDGVARRTRQQRQRQQSTAQPARPGRRRQHRPHGRLALGQSRSGQAGPLCDQHGRFRALTGGARSLLAGPGRIGCGPGQGHRGFEAANEQHAASVVGVHAVRGVGKSGKVGRGRERRYGEGMSLRMVAQDFAEQPRRRAFYLCQLSRKGPTPMPKTSRTLALLLACGSAAASAQVTLKDDGEWRALLGAGLSASSGNTRATSLTVKGEAVRLTPEDKWAIYGDGLYAENEGETSGNQVRLGTRYDFNLTREVFAFGGLDAERDGIADLDLRTALSGGLGYKFVNTPQHTFNVFGGLQYARDRYSEPRPVDGAERVRYSALSALLGEESTHKLTDTVSAKQRFELYPSLKNDGEFRARFDADLAVAMTKALSLTVGVASRYDSEPGIGLKKTDTLLTTGISARFD
ncbi:hypothetical protein C1M51_01015 [Methylibium sp. Pch-M]|nr:hypothetical protein C1M51_01015 [Methylibium sp. Pch-M]